VNPIDLAPSLSRLCRLLPIGGAFSETAFFYSRGHAAVATDVGIVINNA
jgi:hypothetical protein